MGITHSTARWLAPLSFAYDFAAQQYGMFSSPSMLDVHNQHLSFWSPQPYFIAAFFFPQQLFQLAWLYRLYKLRPTNPSEAKELEPMVRFAPYYALGNVCIGTWMFFWNSANLRTSNVFVCINSAAQLWYIATQLDRMNTASTSSVLTHVVAKTFAGIGVLDFLHNTSVAYFQDVAPSATIKALTAVGFGTLALGSDWIFGGCLVYDLVALSVGQSVYTGGGWSSLLGAYAVGTAAIVGLRNYLM
ncbi:hypothetical protein K461DRAFT_248937 [Myriangium duriaei CBS 260.36]|uniref:Uncharacterized protein n=1 Tax=Myriangium duriaei CBS 260.36 TaxID=1168546 RepID=A0A9P4J879_9PEZI|nr:hypothetical protein K461DRAFT_248937 [Myriangium duriaei CBS 260.36]